MHSSRSTEAGIIKHLSASAHRCCEEVRAYKASPACCKCADINVCARGYRAEGKS